MIYYVLEFQTGATGAVIPYSYDNRADAEEKFHEIMKYASKSVVPKHGAMIINEDLFALSAELGYREPEPEPEPEPDEE